jgi:hypothetical protein
MVKKHRILGLTFDERLNWKEHIKDIKARATRKSTKKFIPHIMGLGPVITFADPPIDSIIHTPICSGSLRISLMYGPKTTVYSPPQMCKTGTGYLCNM